jgi:hypothetical protein
MYALRLKYIEETVQAGELHMISTGPFAVQVLGVEQLEDGSTLWKYVQTWMVDYREVPTREEG